MINARATISKDGYGKLWAMPFDLLFTLCHIRHQTMFTPEQNTEKTSAPWDIVMHSISNTAFLDKALPGFIGDSEKLSAPVVKIGNVWRPSFAGDIDSCSIVTAEVGFEKHENQFTVISLEIGQVSTGVGRPVKGYRNTKVDSGYFGDSETTESGYSSFELLIRACGYATMTAKKETGGFRVLSGVTSQEAVTFANGCMFAVKRHRDNEAKKERQLVNPTREKVWRVLP